MKSHAPVPAEGELVIWPGAAIETTLWFVCPAARADEPRSPRCSTWCVETWNLGELASQPRAATA